MVAVHGLSGAALDFEPLGRHLAPKKFVIYAVELRGQGSDPLPSRRGDLASLEDWFADLRAFLALVREKHPGLPFFLYGESMGAAILTRFLAQVSPVDQPAGLILASPVVALPRQPKSWQRLLFKILLGVLPTLHINVRKVAKPKKGELPPYVTRDEAHRTWFETAPHRLDRYTLRFFKCLHDLIDGCFAAAPRINLPVLVIYAAHDVFIPASRVEDFFARLGSRDKERTLFPDAYHLLLHDLDRAQVLISVETWAGEKERYNS